MEQLKSKRHISKYSLLEQVHCTMVHVSEQFVKGIFLVSEHTSIIDVVG